MITAALILGLGTTAGAAKKKRKGKTWVSQITLEHPVSTVFTGTVATKLDACRVQRLITLYYTDPETGQTLPLSVQRTDGTGRWVVSLTAPAYAGTYQAEVSPQKVRAKKAKQTCSGARSASVLV